MTWIQFPNQFTVYSAKILDKFIPTGIIRLFEVLLGPFTIRERIFEGCLYPIRIRPKPILVLEMKYLKFKPLVPELSFIKDKNF